jgi:hypothetical protein
MVTFGFCPELSPLSVGGPGLLQPFVTTSTCPREPTIDERFFKRFIPPETIRLMKIALDAAVASLPEPVSTSHVRAIAETILRSAKEGERDPSALQRMALLELQIAPR